MANAVFVASVASRYDDVLEQQYHFPATYLTRVQQAVGDWIVYYEPRRGGGRLAYFAIAFVTGVTPDPNRPDHYYAHLRDYQEFAAPVPLNAEGRPIESFLRNPDESLNNGAAINAVRILPRVEFDQICQLGMAAVLEEVPAVAPASDLVAETQSDYAGPRQVVAMSRVVRDAAFARVVRSAYHRTCAMTGLSLVGPGSQSEVEAAHIRPVEEDGPDSPRNGLALCRTVHWLFDRGHLSIGDEGQILQSRRHIPEKVQQLLNPSGFIHFPEQRTLAPHPAFLRWHREHRFAG